MTEFDRLYLNLVKKIMNEGIEVENRTGINTIKVPEHHFEFDVGKEFPILQSKQSFYKQAVIEMLWIWQMQSNDVRDLHQRGVHIWDEWMIDSDGIYRIYEPEGKCDYDSNKEVIVLDPFSVSLGEEHLPLKPKLDDSGKVMMAKSIKEGKTIKAAKYYGIDQAYTIGSAYGFITRRYQHTQNIIRTAVNCPSDRRIVKSLWQDEFLRGAVLPSCVWSTEWDITNGKLSLLVHQRSCDVPLGLPFNITQYATLLKMIAQVTNLEVGKMYYSIKDAHIYTNQLEGMKELLRRDNKYSEFQNLSKEELIALKNNLQEYLLKINKDDSRYNAIETEARIADIILDPTKPDLELDPSIYDFFKFDNSKELKHIKLKSYKHMGKITFPIAQ